MRGGLGERFGDNGGLLEFDAETEVDDRMESAFVHACEHGVGGLVPREDILLDDLFPALGGDFALEELEEGVVLADYAEGFVEEFAVGELLEDCVVDFWDGALDGGAVVVAIAEFLRCGAQGEDGEEAVDDVVVACGVAEEHVVLLMVLLQESVTFFQRIGWDIGTFENAKVVG